MGFICIDCRGGEIVEFDNMVLLNNHRRNIHLSQPQPEAKKEASAVSLAIEDFPVKPSITQKPALKPIILHYKYEGNCTLCGREVDTIEINLPDSYRNALISYCSICKKQLTQELVIPLSQQDSESNRTITVSGDRSKPDREEPKVQIPPTENFPGKPGKRGRPRK